MSRKNTNGCNDSKCSGYALYTDECTACGGTFCMMCLRECKKRCNARLCYHCVNHHVCSEMDKRERMRFGCSGCDNIVTYTRRKCSDRDVVHRDNIHCDECMVYCQQEKCDTVFCSEKCEGRSFCKTCDLLVCRRCLSKHEKECIEEEDDDDESTSHALELIQQEQYRAVMDDVRDASQDDA